MILANIQPNGNAQAILFQKAIKACIRVLLKQASKVPFVRDTLGLFYLLWANQYLIKVYRNSQ